MGADANRAAAADRSPPTAKRGRLSERAWTDILRGARLARAEGVELLMHGVKITGTRKPSPVKMASCKGLQQPVEPAVPKPPLAKADDASPPPLSKREERSARRLQVFQQKKRAEIFAARYGGSTSGKSADRHEQIYQRKGWHPALARAKLRAMLWRAWARYRPIYGGVVLGYTTATHRCESSMCTDRRLDYTRRRSRSIRARAAAPWPRGLAMQRPWRKTLSAASSRPRSDSVASGRRSRAWAERAWGG